MIFREGELEFDFSDAIDGFKFDEKNRQSKYFHELSHCMKAVDFIIERNNDYLFVEVKDFHSPDEYKKTEKFTNLKNTLKSKYRDTFLYRFAENRLNKPVRYLCLMTLEDALTNRLMKEMRRIIPEGKASKRWKIPIAESCVVANIKRWNSKFPEWTVRRIKSDTEE